MGATRRILLCIVEILSLLLLRNAPAYAGPPFRTDDPETVEQRHFEINLFSTGTTTRDGSYGTLPGLEMNYGAAPGLQLHTIVPTDYADPSGHARFGMGDLEFGAKYRLFKPGEEDWYPQIATFPLIEVPVGNQRLGFSTGHPQIFLPMWLQKDLDPWTIYGGGGYWANPGFSNKNYGFAGVALWRRITPEWRVGAELYHQTSFATSVPQSTGFNIGTTYDLSEHWHLLFSTGTGLQNRSLTNKLSFYVAMQARF